MEPPSSATGDIAFNLIVFFLVCASVEPDAGIKQSLPASEQTQQESQTEHIQVEITRAGQKINEQVIRKEEFLSRLKRLLKGKTKEEDRVVVVKSGQDATWQHWLEVTTLIDDAGGIMTMQLEEEREVMIPQ